MEMKETRGQGYHGGEGDQSHGKKSVLKKVKEKAKKLKDSTIGKKKHREGEGGQPHEGEVREHGLPLDYMEEEEEVEEEVEEKDEEGNFLGADRPPGNVTEKVVQSEPSAAVRPGIYKPPPPEGPDPLDVGSVTGLKDVLNWPMLGSVDLSAKVSEQESHLLDQDPGANRSEPGLLISDIQRANRKPAVREDDDLGRVLNSIKDLKFSDEFPAGSHDQFAPEPPAESDVAGSARPTSTLQTEKPALAEDAMASMVHPKRDDEGVSATKYVMKKLSPGEEDRALSEVIQEAIHTTTKVGDGGDTQAGAKKSGSEAAAGGDRIGVVEKVKEMASSLVGRDQRHHGASDLAGEGEGAEERKLQESTN